MWICKYSNSLFSIVNKSRTAWDKHTVKYKMPLLVSMFNLCLFEKMLGWSLNPGEVKKASVEGYLGCF